VVNISSSKKVAGISGKEFREKFKDHPLREFFGDEFFRRFLPDMPRGRRSRPRGMGSGVIVSNDGHILTNAHVVKNADEILVTLPDKREFQAKVIGADEDSDIAVIKIDANNLPTAELGDSDAMSVGEIVLAIGNPFGLNSTVTSGIVSAKGRTNVGIIEYEDFIQTDAAINPGNSGGPLVNIRGEVVGINTAIASRSGGYQGIGFAIPSNSAKLIMKDLIKEGRVRRGLLGVNIQNLDEALAKSFNRDSSEGALVSQVVKDSAADKAGVKSGDIILKFGGKDVKGASHLKNLVGRKKPGAKTTVTIYRDGKEKTLNVTVGEKTPEALAKAGKTPDKEATSNEWGIEVRPVPVQKSNRWDIEPGEGVEITDVDMDGVGAEMGLRQGDIVLEVNGKAIKGVDTFEKAISGLKKGDVARLKIQRNNMRLFLGAPVG
jgi:serine protease Do